ncbi:hypothetical protein [Aquimonas voraii]|uniref:Uncharacterized protein n=1 Tax=Aquimonas voraii TaxID=265719 RepID=A0A1G6T2B8_9GAMM|nr:hypothetical protein [Aquimonas voraii]SDD23141.1 hypothetical protein SAMN04488509_101840 [Aquimonas voraii]
MIQISDELNAYRLQGVITFLALGTEQARAHVYAGPRPGFGEAPQGPLLASIVLAEPLGTVVDGVLEVAPTNEALILTTGEATWARIVNGNGALGWDCDASDLEGMGELRLPTTTLYAGGYTRILTGLLG